MSRSDRITLTPYTTQELVRPVLQQTWERPDWRLIEAWSHDGRPWELFLNWSVSGAIQSTGLRVSVGTAARVCVFGIAVEVGALNRSLQSQQIGLMVATGHEWTRNHLDRWAQADGVNAVSFKVPPYAARVELMMSERSAAAMTMVKVIGGMGQEVACPFSAIPADGIPLGDVTELEIAPPVAMMLRATFYLTV